MAMGEEDKRAPKMKPIEPPPPPPGSDGIKIFTLRKSIQAHGEEMKELKIREPSAGDIIKCGYPVSLKPLQGGGIQVVVEEEKMSAMISELAVIPPSSVRQLSTRDWATLTTYLQTFFVPDWDQLLLT